MTLILMNQTEAEYRQGTVIQMRDYECLFIQNANIWIK